MTILIFVRHGETDWSRTTEHRFRGRIDIPLNAKGVQQAKAVSRRLANEDISVIYSSPFKRAWNTAKEIAELHNLPVTSHQGFIDLNFGDWQEQLHSELAKTEPELYNRWLNEPHTMTFPNGESLAAVRERIEHAIPELVIKHENETIVITTHGAVLRVIHCLLHHVGNDNYWKFNMDNCAITIARSEHGKYSILAENDNSHLSKL